MAKKVITLEVKSRNRREQAKLAALVDRAISEFGWRDGEEEEAGQYLLMLQEISRQLSGGYASVPRPSIDE